MGVAVLLARVVIASIFAVSGAAKLRSFRQSRTNMLEFGVPDAMASVATGLLIAVELSVPLLILPVATAQYGGMAALAMLAIFCVAIATNLLLHRTPQCNCFGQLHSAPISWRMLSRNVVLGAVAAGVVAETRDGGALSAIAWIQSLGTGSLAVVALSSVAVALLVVIAACLVQIVRQQGRVLLRLESLERAAVAQPDEAPKPTAPEIGLPLGSKAPEFVLNALHGGRTSLADLLGRSKPVLLLFSHPACGPCQSLLPNIANWQRDLDEVLTVAVISEGTAAAHRSYVRKHHVRRLLLQEGREIAERYLANGTPSAVLIAANGNIASYLAQGADPVRSLVKAVASQAQADEAAAKAITVGDAAPDLSFEALSGDKVVLSELRGRRSLLLFWNPQCGFCQRMLPELKEWETTAPAGSPRLIVLSTGAATENRTMGLRSTIVSDEQMSAASAFGANGTPMAVLLDEDGHVASGVAAGKDAVFELASRPGSSIEQREAALREA